MSRLVNECLESPISVSNQVWGDWGMSRLVSECPEWRSRPVVLGLVSYYATISI